MNFSVTTPVRRISPDACEDVVGRLVPAEGLGVLVDRFDIRGDGLLQLDGRAVNPAPDLLLRQIGEEPLHLVES